MLKSALFMFLCSCLLGRLDCTDNKQLTVKRGENAALQCSGSRGAAVMMLMWRKPDQKAELEKPDQELYVLFIRENRSYENLQLPSFKGRVQLRDPEMKDGDLSVILKNVSMNDAGKYECYAGYNKTKLQLMNNITLKVEESGHRGGQSGDGGNKDEVSEDGGEKSGSVGLIAGLSVLAVLLLVVGGVVGFMIYRKRRNQSNPDYRPPPDQGLEKLPVASYLNCESCCCSRFLAASSTFRLTDALRAVRVNNGKLNL